MFSKIIKLFGETQTTLKYITSNFVGTSVQQFINNVGSSLGTQWNLNVGGTAYGFKNLFDKDYYYELLNLVGGVLGDLYNDKNDTLSRNAEKK